LGLIRSSKVPFRSFAALARILPFRPLVLAKPYGVPPLILPAIGLNMPPPFNISSNNESQSVMLLALSGAAIGGK
jgi:hypothetical protein